MQKLQFIQITPEELQSEILKGVKTQFEEFVKYFQPKVPTEYLTRQETADFLKVDLSTIWNYTRRGLLKSHGIGSRVYYKRAEVENAIVELKK